MRSALSLFLGLCALPDQERSIAQDSAPISNVLSRYMALRKIITTQQIRQLLRVNTVVLFLAGKDRLQHGRMRHFHRQAGLDQVIIDPRRKQSRLHAGHTRHRQMPHPGIKRIAAGG